MLRVIHPCVLPLRYLHTGPVDLVHLAALVFGTRASHTNYRLYALRKLKISFDPAVTNTIGSGGKINKLHSVLTAW